MKITLDIDRLQADGIITAPTADLLRRHALKSDGFAAINILLALGAVAVAAGIMGLHPDPERSALAGLAFVVIGALLKRNYAEQWSKLGSIWMVVGGLTLAASAGILTEAPAPASLTAACVLVGIGVMAQSALLIALVPFALASAVGGSTGYWHACYELSIEEPTVTILMFSLLAVISWKMAFLMRAAYRDLAILFARICVLLVNFGFWIGSLWGDTPGASWRHEPDLARYFDTAKTLPASVFIVGWLACLLWAAVWGARHQRKFMVNTAAVFGSIHLYTQWFEHFGVYPFTVILSGLAGIIIGLGLWRYNRPASAEAL